MNVICQGILEWRRVLNVTKVDGLFLKLFGIAFWKPTVTYFHPVCEKGLQKKKTDKKVRSRKTDVIKDKCGRPFKRDML